MSFNRTNVELKYDPQHAAKLFKKAFNRTNVELK